MSFCRYGTNGALAPRTTGFLIENANGTIKVKNNIQDSAIPASTGTAMPVGIKKDSNGDPQLVQAPTTSQSKTTGAQSKTVGSQSKTTGSQSKTTGTQSKVSEIWKFETVAGQTIDKEVITSVTLEPSVIKDVTLEPSVIKDVTLETSVIKDVSLQTTVVTGVTVASKVVTGA